MHLVVLDLNALIGMQLEKMRPAIELHLGNDQNLLIISDHFFLEACDAGMPRLEKMLSALIPYRDRVRVGRWHHELIGMEVSMRGAICPAHLMSADGRSERVQNQLEDLSNGKHPFRAFFPKNKLPRPLRKRLSLPATAREIHRRFDILEEAVTKTDGNKSLRGDHDKDLRKRLFLMREWETNAIELCVRLARRHTAEILEYYGAGKDVAARIASGDSFTFRRELAYWIRCLMLRRDDKLHTLKRRALELIRNEHFDVEFVGFSSHAHLAVTDDKDNRKNLELLERAMEHVKAKWIGPAIEPTRIQRVPQVSPLHTPP